MDTKNIKAESILNREGDILPFGYYNPQTDGKLTWICNEDKDAKITSVFDFDTGDGHEKQCDYLNDLSGAIFMREELIKNGWKKLSPPEVTFKFPGEKEERSLTRQEKRELKIKMKRMDKQNPFNK